MDNNTEEQIRKYIEKSRRVRVMIKHKAYKFRIYPNAQQEILINKNRRLKLLDYMRKL
ncbi:helix-turn-helix domain-containing protein [Staphylococcus sp. MI 10-1553]|uniref:helix-turn-helix domain-containing protein n=1 Tax=Staphylococcus sp. MI 10-1553 TaxID=1912064 RepID=UPI0031BAE54C